MSYTERLPVVPGQRYEVQLRAKSIAGRMRLKVKCYTSAAFNVLDAVPSGGVSISTDNAFFTSQDLDSYDLLWGFFTAPATAQYARIFVETERSSNANDTYYFVALPLLGEAGVAQTLPSPWADGETGVATDLIANAAATVVDQVLDATGTTTSSTSQVSLISDTITNDDAYTRDVVVTAVISYSATRASGQTLDLKFYLHDGTTAHQLANVTEATETGVVKGTVTVTRSFSVAAGATLSHSARVLQAGFTGSSTYSNLVLRAEVIKK